MFKTVFFHVENDTLAGVAGLDGAAGGGDGDGVDAAGAGAGVVCGEF